MGSKIVFCALGLCDIKWAIFWTTHASLWIEHRTNITHMFKNVSKWPYCIAANQISHPKHLFVPSHVITNNFLHGASLFSVIMGMNALYCSWLYRICSCLHAYLRLAMDCRIKFLYRIVTICIISTPEVCFHSLHEWDIRNQSYWI
jgi:hypothetical protein